MRKSNLILALMPLLLFACKASDNGGIQSAVERQLRDFSQSHLQDIYKSFYQNYFGAEHLISDTASVRAYLRREIAEAAGDTVPNPYYEPVGSNGQFVRVYLRNVTEHFITEQQLFDAFLRSARPQRRPSEAWHRLWTEDIVAAARQAGLDFSQEDLDALSDASAQKRAVGHSDDYRDAYHPHYRIVERHIFENEIAPYLPKDSPADNTLR